MDFGSQRVEAELPESVAKEAIVTRLEPVQREAARDTECGRTRRVPEARVLPPRDVCHGTSLEPQSYIRSPDRNATSFRAWS